jgi:hypothetical protein
MSAQMSLEIGEKLTFWSEAILHIKTSFISAIALEI